MTRPVSLFFMTVALGVAGFAASAAAQVSLRNGNFFMGYSDLLYPGGFDPKIERVYNSKSVYKGFFGWGWGNEYEVYLTVSADGSVVVHEYGGGSETRFTPVAFNAQELDKAVDAIAAVAQKGGALGSQEQITSYKKQLKSNADFRNREWEKYRALGKLESRQLKEGTELVSNKYTFQKVTKVAGGYVRAFENGKTEKFNDAGKLVRVMDKNNNFVELAYTRDGKLEKLSDNLNRKMFFKFNTRGLLEQIDGENGKKAEYKYNDLSELIYAKNVEGATYQYKYDAQRRHNLVEITYDDKTTLTISYYPKEQNESVRSTKDRDGTVSEYKYDRDPADSGHLAVTVTMKDSDGKESSKSKYEYFIKRKADGEEWQYKLVTDFNGDRTETTYNECCGLPLLIKRGEEETAFEYDTKGHVTKKITPTDVTELAYDPKVGKVIKVVRYSKLDKKQMSWSQFQYDPRGNLIFAKNSEGKGVKLFYDSSGQIKTMVDHNQRQISFKYNESKRPVEISDPKLGTITVTYTNSGEVKKVDSPAGRKMALQVTAAFQNLMDIVRPAGVSLSF